MTMPALFIAHGSPMLLSDAPRVAGLAAWAQNLPRPQAILIVSAHWEERDLVIGATSPQPLIYDFSGFPEALYQVQYPCPSAPALANRVEELLAGVTKTQRAPARGYDHGVYVPLLCCYPEADIPVLQIAIPKVPPAELIHIGQALAPLREEGVMIIGSGYITHNMGAGFHSGPPRAWASAFDSWIADAVLHKNIEALANFETAAPGAKDSLPTDEHFLPLLMSFGASLPYDAPITFPIEGFEYGSFSRRSVQFG
jgi:4,5-DOPA dioxygenase extradiol